jgi:addiction module HigA family antidote
VADAAHILGVSRQALSNLLTGRAGISPEMAIRLAKAFGGREEEWLQVQLAFDLEEARQKLGALAVTPVASYKARQADEQLKML